MAKKKIKAEIKKKAEKCTHCGGDGIGCDGTGRKS